MSMLIFSNFVVVFCSLFQKSITPLVVLVVVSFAVVLQFYMRRKKERNYNKKFLRSHSSRFLPLSLSLCFFLVRQPPSINKGSQFASIYIFCIDAVTAVAAFVLIRSIIQLVFFSFNVSSISIAVQCNVAAI